MLDGITGRTTGGPVVVVVVVVVVIVVVLVGDGGSQPKLGMLDWQRHDKPPSNPFPLSPEPGAKM